MSVFWYMLKFYIYGWIIYGKWRKRESSNFMILREYNILEYSSRVKSTRYIRGKTGEKKNKNKKRRASSPFSRWRDKLCRLFTLRLFDVRFNRGFYFFFIKLFSIHLHACLHFVLFSLVFLRTLYFIYFFLMTFLYHKMNNSRMNEGRENKFNSCTFQRFFNLS